MGGEPTFVSTTDRDADEWNLSALGPTKRFLAADLLWRLKQRYGAGGFLHFGQGKWYPGEQLPRWTLGCYWRADGEPAWRDPALFADERQPDGHGAADAARFITTLAAELHLTDAHVQAGYEDVWYYLWRERKLPVERRSVRRAPGRRARTRSAAPHFYAGARRDRRLRAAASTQAAARRRGSPGRGSCVPSVSICFRAIRRWDCGCRSTRCPGRPRAIATRCTNAIRSRRDASLPSPRRCRHDSNQRGADDPLMQARPGGAGRVDARRRRRRRQPALGSGSASAAAGAQSDRAPSRGESAQRRRSLGAVCRAAPRRVVRVHAAGRDARGLSGSGRGD